ncbi:ABC transporter ATP-binding protein [Alloiococcus sp. CFN-8]|uniref:ABC transporter ATP-binding protein n=1 Tax=Alloiococcus sp. CFN-8 TaxID=3416081 RepID=UPI003CEA6D00
MDIITAENLSFSYPDSTRSALNNINLTIEDGEIMLICGGSGCGKSTLLRHFKSVLTPYGSREGRVLFKGRPLEEYDSMEQSQRIGYVLQHPEDQIVTDKVWHELAFGLENHGVDQEIMRLRVGEMASYFGIQQWFHKSVTELSGGQKQLLSLASVMAMSPEVLILDEPTSQLDPIAASEFLNTLKKLNQELGLTIILSEHRLEEALPLADRVAVMDSGRLIACGAPREVALTLKSKKHPIFQAMPTPVRVFGGISFKGTCPLTVKEGRRMLQACIDEREAENCCDRTSVEDKETNETTSDSTPMRKDSVLQLKECFFRYSREGEDIIKGLSMDLYSGEILALVGGNGAGKSTALSLLAGENKPYRGKVIVQGKVEKTCFSPWELGIGALCQDPRSIFVKNTVEEDLKEMLQGKKIPEAEKEERLRTAIAAMDIEPYLTMHPFDLSGGEQQRAAIAKLLVGKPDILLLDEPTKGMDAAFKKSFGKLLRSLADKGKAIVVVSHDIEFCAEFSTRCGLFFNGSIISENAPRAFFSGNHFYTTSANRMARHLFPKAILPQEVIEACSQQLQEG